MRGIFATALLIPLSVLASPLSLNNLEESVLAPLNEGGEHIDDSYIVVFKKGVDPNQIALHLSGVNDWHGADVSPSTCYYRLNHPYQLDTP